ncbi:hypothetical protein MNB_SV-9-237 [hydrothermal vent metagenome]|uniref:Uncharacterized protein n=1 Tax=hydrothermal vent metagenome TaxID=652676 RepID=A0A1W1BDE5_9ZZZZ
MKIEDEPSLETIDDYNNNESPEKRKNIYMIIFGLLILGVILTSIKMSNNSVSDKIETSPNAKVVE